ncbi:hypothetical protein PR202_gb06313 [Eleusine coracana subsp. coracana]|uniref:Uncharacterized protein n=1 Tax=Eleusine coracana subsp. coracana TaxID=191504 RepID=A0AAV5E972_ELECO|nr:hypothetical protein PR202_gb06313 [Eleusine coracana subsp. coracana]
MGPLVWADGRLLSLSLLPRRFVLRRARRRPRLLAFLPERNGTDPRPILISSRRSSPNITSDHSPCSSNQSSGDARPSLLSSRVEMQQRWPSLPPALPYSRIHKPR